MGNWILIVRSGSYFFCFLVVTVFGKENEKNTKEKYNRASFYKLFYKVMSILQPQGFECSS